MRALKISVEDLRREPAFARLSPPELSALAVCIRAASCAPGQALFSEGGPPGSMFYVAKGSFVIEAKRGKSGLRVIGRAGPGETLGELSLLDPAPRSATITAETAAVVYEVAEDAMDVLRRQAPGALAAVLRVATRTMATRLRKLDARIAGALR